MKRSRYVIWSLVLIAISALGAFGLFRVARESVASEGYDTDEAAWYYLIRRGEIRFRLTEGSRVTAISSGEGSGVIAKPYEAYVRLGYGAFLTDLKYIDINGVARSITTRTDKFNHWNRVLYIQDESGDFTRIDNGVVQKPDSIQIIQGEQGAS